MPDEQKKELLSNAVRLDILKVVQEEKAKYAPNNSYMKGAIDMATQIEKLIKEGLVKKA